MCDVCCYSRVGAGGCGASAAGGGGGMMVVVVRVVVVAVVVAIGLHALRHGQVSRQAQQHLSFGA